MQGWAGRRHCQMLGSRSSWGPSQTPHQGASPHRTVCTLASARQLRGWVQGTQVRGSRTENVGERRALCFQPLVWMRP